MRLVIRQLNSRLDGCLQDTVPIRSVHVIQLRTCSLSAGSSERCLQRSPSAPCSSAVYLEYCCTPASDPRPGQRSLSVMVINNSGKNAG